jgi:hypothetical protein
LLDEDRSRNVYVPLYYVDSKFENGAMHIYGEERDPLSGKLTAMA